MPDLRIIFAGTPAFSVPSLEALIKAGHHIVAVYTQPDRPAGRGRKIQMSPIKSCAMAHDLPVFQPQTLRDPSEQQKLSALKADVMIVVAYGLILPAAVLQAPRMGCLNAHASLLPRWRGAAPIQRAILAGDTETGITIMQMDEGLDTGNMLLKTSCPIEPTDTAASLHDKLAILGAKALVTALEQYTHLKPVPQDNSLATYAQKISREDARIDWQRSADEIARQVRAFNPWPGAFTGKNDAPVKIWQAEALTNISGEEMLTGQIICANAKGLDVATGNGILRIESIQLPGGKNLPVAAILNARKDQFRPGSLIQTIPRPI